MKFFSKSVKAVQATLLAVAILCAGDACARTLDRVVAKVNDEIITQSAVHERMKAELMRLRGVPQSEMPPEKEMVSMVVKRMVDEKLQLQDAKKLGVTVDEESVIKALNDIKRNNNIDDYQFEALLKKEATTLEEYKETIKKQILVSKIVGYQVRNRIKISDADVAKYYKAHRKEFRNPPQVHARHILFIFDEKTTEEQKKTKEATARKVLARIEGGEDFVELARKFSEDVSAANGGDLGFLEKGKMVPEFEDAVFSLKQGQVSDLVRTPYGIHIIKVDSVKATEFKTLEEIRPEIENKLYGERQAKVYENYMKDLRKAAFIEISIDEKKARENKISRNQRASKNLWTPVSRSTRSERLDPIRGLPETVRAE